jgi:hypothetical protein
MIKNCNLLIPTPLKRTSKIQGTHSAPKKEHPALQNKRFLNFSPFLWVILAPLDAKPDLDDQNQNQCESMRIRI